MPDVPGHGFLLCISSEPPPLPGSAQSNGSIPTAGRTRPSLTRKSIMLVTTYFSGLHARHRTAFRTLYFRISCLKISNHYSIFELVSLPRERCSSVDAKFRSFGRQHQGSGVALGARGHQRHPSTAGFTSLSALSQRRSQSPLEVNPPWTLLCLVSYHRSSVKRHGVSLRIFPTPQPVDGHRGPFPSMVLSHEHTNSPSDQLVF